MLSPYCQQPPPDHLGLATVEIWGVLLTACGKKVRRAIPSHILKTVKLICDSRNGRSDNGIVQGDAQGGDAEGEYAQGESNPGQVRRLGADIVSGGGYGWRFLVRWVRRLLARGGVVICHVGLGRGGKCRMGCKENYVNSCTCEKWQRMD